MRGLLSWLRRCAADPMLIVGGGDGYYRIDGNGKSMRLPDVNIYASRPASQKQLARAFVRVAKRKSKRKPVARKRKTGRR